MLNSKEFEKLVRDARAAGKRSEIVDGDGLYLDVTAAGAMTWRYRYRLNGKREKFTIGAYPKIGLADARTIHKKLVGKVADGKSPVGDERDKAQAERTAKVAGTIADLATKYLADLADRGKKARSVQWHIDAHIVPGIGKVRSLDLTTKQVRDLCNRIKDVDGAPASAREVLGTIKRMLQFGADAGLIPSNVAAAIKPQIYASKAERERSLSQDELRQFLQGLDAGKLSLVVSSALRVILLTMTRKNEAIKAPWSEFDRDAGLWEVAAERTKLQRSHVVPLSSQAMAVLEALRPDAEEANTAWSQWVFLGQAGRPLSDTTLNEALSREKWFGLERFTVHDLRRTASTILHEQGWNTDVIEKALNHKMKGVRGIYNKAEYLDQRREMLQAWADYLDALKSGAKVVPIGKGKAA